MCDGGGVGGFLSDAVDFTKSSIGALSGHLGDMVTPGFDPVLGNPLKGDFMNGDAVITPTGNWSQGVWDDMYDKAGDDTGALDRFYGYNQIADKIAPVIAGGAFAGSSAGASLAGAGGAGEGAAYSGAGTSLGSSGTALGSTEGLSAGAGSGWGAVGGSAAGAAGGFGGSEAIGQGGDLLGSTSGMSAINPGVSSAVQGNNVNFLDSLQSLFKYGSDASNSPLGKTTQGLGKVFGAYQDYRGTQNAQRAAQNNVDTLQNLYSPNSPYAQQMAQTLARRDAASGRNSQYGPRAEALAADLTKNQAGVLGSSQYGNMLGVASNTSYPWSSLGAGLSGAGQLYSGLRGLF